MPQSTDVSLAALPPSAISTANLSEANSKVTVELGKIHYLKDFNALE